MIDFKAINEFALAQGLPFFEKLLPDGVLQGDEYSCASIHGGKGNSFKINIKTGKWIENNGGEIGGDPISVIAARDNIPQSKAAKIIMDMTGYPEYTSIKTKKAIETKTDKPYVISPVPKEYADKTPNIRHWKYGKPSGVYAYRDEKGKLLGYRCRFNKEEINESSKPKKEFYPYSYTDKGWKFKGLPEPYPFYGLHAMATMPKNTPILVVEGESNADTLQSILGQKYAVLSYYSGSNSANKMDCNPLKDRDVYIHPDNDLAGFKAALTLAKALNGIAASIKIIEPPKDKPLKWDLKDAIEKDGWDSSQIEGLIIGHRYDPDEFQSIAIKRFPELEKITGKEVQEDYNENDGDILPLPPDSPIHAFLHEIQELLIDASNTFYAPIEVPIACLLGLVSSLVGSIRKVKITDSWTPAANLWIAVLAKSTVGKSPVYSHFFEILKSLEYEDYLRFCEEVKIYENDLEAWKQEKKDKSDMIKPLPPNRPKQILLDDSTLEAMGKVMQENPGGIAWARDELGSFFTDFDRYSKTGKAGAISRLLSSYDNQSWKINRGNSEKNLYVKNACLTIFGGMQPEILNKVFRRIDADNGLLARFSFIRAEKTKPVYFNDKGFSEKSRELLKKITESIWNWRTKQENPDSEERFVEMTDEASSLYIKYYNKLEDEGFSDERSAMLNKLKEKAAKIALILHCMESAIKGSDGYEAITGDCMERALLIADWIKENDKQAWDIFSRENIAMPDSIQRGIIKLIHSQEEFIRKNNFRISNEWLSKELKNILNLDVSNKKIGRACSNLKLKSFRTGTSRGWEIKENFILKCKT